MVDWSEFLAALKAEERHASIPESDDIYDRLLGEWDFEWVDHAGTPEERRMRGEWLFARALEGRAVLDLFICPSREERKRERTQSDGGIVHRMTKGEYAVAWAFSDITGDSFHWSNRMGRDNGRTWETIGDVYAARRERLT
ncbi:MAG: hypothetical protein LBS30_07385 [Planctomycetota bacterium]|jgi:hypothetical protein|nr:hypothetical protein [Planctomycetota bacterium]